MSAIQLPLQNIAAASLSKKLQNANGIPSKQHVGQWFFLAKTFTKGSVQLLCKTRCPQRFSSCLLHFFTVGFLEQKIALGYGVLGGV